MENPYQSPEVIPEFTIDTETVTVKRPELLPGMRRVRFWQIFIEVEVTNFLIWMAVKVLGYSIFWAMAASIPFLVIYLIIVRSRLRNIGSNANWCYLMFVPIANLFLLVRCLVAPEGYAYSKTLDNAGKVIATLVMVAFTLVVGSIAWILMNNA